MKNPIGLLVISAQLVACGGDDESSISIPENTADAIANYAEIVHASYNDSLAAAQAMDSAIGTLITTPTAQNLAAAQTAWIDSREPYLQTEVYRFYDGPIDDADGPEGLLNAWPLDEFYIDYVDGMLNAGIVNDTNVTIDAATLESLNEEGGDKNIATGYHAIEFLLWGQDLDVNGPGARPYTDYVTDGSGTAENQDRRGDYLQTVSTLLISNLQSMVDEWDGGGNNFRADFVAAEPEESLARILTGMYLLAGFETGEERLLAAYDAQDQEEEHSCFSDNTHRDMIQDIQGVQNVWLGSYGSISGVGIRDVIAETDPQLASAITAQLEDALAKANALQPPFDQELVTTEGRARIFALIESLRGSDEVTVHLESLLEDAFQLYGLTVPPKE